MLITLNACPDAVRRECSEQQLIGLKIQDRSNKGYGSCSRCACNAYEGNDYVCTNCGHSYDDHY
jgi:hypothetical protein